MKLSSALYLLVISLLDEISLRVSFGSSETATRR